MNIELFEYEDYCIRRAYRQPRYRCGIDHLLFSADYPYIPQDEARAFLENAPLTDTDKELFACGNAAKLLHL